MFAFSLKKRTDFQLVKVKKSVRKRFVSQKRIGIALQFFYNGCLKNLIVTHHYMATMGNTINENKNSLTAVSFESDS